MMSEENDTDTREFMAQREVGIKKKTEFKIYIHKNSINKLNKGRL